MFIFKYKRGIRPRIDKLTTRFLLKTKTISISILLDLIIYE
jgi:hypothetical protein